MPVTHEQIYSAIVEYCRPAPQLPLLQHLPAAEGARCGASDPDDLLRKLLKRFSSEVLREAGVLVPAGAAATAERLHEDLATENRRFIALCDATTRPFDLLTARGSLRYQCVAVHSVSQDEHFRKCLRNTETIFVTFSIEDTIIFRSLGLAATPAIGLDQLRGSRLDAFMRLLPADREVGTQNRSPRATTVFLVGWSFATTKCAAAGFAAAVSHLQKLHDVLSVPLEPLQIWRPSDDEVERLIFALRNDRSKDIASRIVEMAEAGSRPLVEPPKIKVSAAFAELRKAACEPHNEINISYARRRLAAIHREYFEDRLMDEAEAEPDPLEASIKLMIARLVGELHALHIDRLLKKNNSSPAAREGDREDLQKIQSLLNMIMKLAKTTKPCAKKLTANSAFPFHVPRSRS